ncbi:uroporphyrinogen-III C-methyltransferase [uncultured Cedecea sp.]|uniref:uroporphyrinogen-III C-methyltransferase n=1 Tax=uncultured Cedecea sp. TaxID=988762 RepID=UPI00261E6E44|nr:uroporphyrinogen-III C-methyltransferase [uncultured Cedecea sp.]
MTEQQNNSDTAAEEIKSAVETTQSSESTAKNSRTGSVGIALGAIAIVIALAVAGGVYHYSGSQLSSQTAANTALTNQLQLLQEQQTAQQREFSAQLAQQTAALQDSLKQQAILTQQLETVQEKVASFSGNDAKAWLLSQADFLVKLAGRKLWSDQDVTTAAALLKTADASLSDMNDPSIIPVRRALTDDITTLAKISQVDYDGIILKLNQLSNNIDNLRLSDNYSDGSPMDSDGTELSGSLAEWRQNLLKSWNSFMDSFITIRRRDETAIPLLAPNQDIYLRENIRSQLLVAAQAVPRHQQEIYKQSLETVSTWVRAYYDTDDASTKTFLDELDNLIDQNINMDVPEALQSQALLEKLVQTRVRSLFAQSTTAPTDEAPQSNTTATTAEPEDKPETVVEAKPESTPEPSKGE